MVPSILVAGWLLDISRELYRLLYRWPAGAHVACWYYHTFTSASGRWRGTQPPRQRPRRSADPASDRPTCSSSFARSFLRVSFLHVHAHRALLVYDRFNFSAFDLASVDDGLPQLLLALSSPIWGRVLAASESVHCRLLVSVIQSASLAVLRVGSLAAARLYFTRKYSARVDNGAVSLPGPRRRATSLRSRGCTPLQRHPLC